MIELREAQKAMRAAIVERRRLLMVAPMGSGKTLATLSALADLLQSGEVKTCLIIAPLRVAKTVWVQEAQKYGFIDMNIQMCKRMLDYKLMLVSDAPHKVCVASVTMLDEVPHGCWDMVIADESTLFGNPKARRSKEMKRICKGVRRRLLLTGTPVHGGYEKLYFQALLLDEGQALGRTLSEFRYRYMKIKFKLNGVVTVYDMRQDAIPILIRDIQPLIYVVRDKVDLPPVLINNIAVDLPPKRLKEYDMFMRDSILEYEKENGKPVSDKPFLIAFNNSARGMRLRQLASGYVYTNEERTEFTETHSEKIKVLKDIVETACRGVLVAYQFKCEIAAIRNYFPTARELKTADDIKAWNAGEIELALIHPASVGHGLNLQFGGNTIVWFSLPNCDLEQYAQCNKRLDRPGQTEIVTVVNIIARNTIDEKILNTLLTKEERTKQL